VEVTRTSSAGPSYRGKRRNPLTKKELEVLRKKVEELTKISFDEYSLNLWKKHPTLRVMTTWRAGNRSGLSLPTITYLCGMTYTAARRDIKALGHLVSKSYCGDTGHVIYHPAWKHDDIWNDVEGGYQKAPHQHFVRARNWAWHNAAALERQRFDEGVYPRAKELKEKSDSEMRKLSCSGTQRFGHYFRNSAIQVRTWNKLKKAAACV
jgi:hypothetical protein